MSCRPLLLAFVVVAAACGGKNRGPEKPHSATVPIPTVRVGDCATPDRDGVHGDSPKMKRADRDLDGDGNPEAVVADQTMCSSDGNCYWNVFIRSEASGCERYAGALAGAALEPLAADAGMPWPPVRAYWNLGGGKRVLVQEYQFRRGGYVLADALLCRREADDRLQCTEAVR